MRHSPLFLLVICALAALLAACGPRDIGTGTSEPDTTPAGVSGADTMRQPMTGNNSTQTMLYYFNRPDVMQSMQRSQFNTYMRHMGRDIPPEDPGLPGRPPAAQPLPPIEEHHGSCHPCRQRRPGHAGHAAAPRHTLGPAPGSLRGCRSRPGHPGRQRPLQTLLLHRGITHALAAAPLMGLLLAILARSLWRYDTRNAWSFGGVWAFMMLLVLLHIWLDALTTYGTLVWLPFSGERLRLNAVYIIDLLMTLPLLWGIWHGLRQEKKRARAQGAIPSPSRKRPRSPSLTASPASGWPCSGASSSTRPWPWAARSAHAAAAGRPCPPRDGTSASWWYCPMPSRPCSGGRSIWKSCPPGPPAPPSWQTELDPLLPPADRQEDLVVRIQGLDALGRPHGREETRVAAPAGLMTALARQSVACRAFERFLLLPVITPLSEGLRTTDMPGASQWLLHDERFGSQLELVRKIVAMRPNAGIPFQLMLQLEPGNMGPRLLQERLYFSDSRRDSGWQAPRRPSPPAFLPWLAGLR